MKNWIHDFGPVSQGEKVRCEFLLTNESENNIRINTVIPTCGCTVVEYTPELVKPSAKLRLTAEWNVGANRGATQVHITVLAQGASDQLQQIPLRIMGNVTPDILYDATTLEFTPSTGVKRITFSPGTMKSFVLKRAYSPHRAFKASVEPDGVTIGVTCHPEDVADLVLESFVLVETSSANEPNLKIPVMLRLPGPHK